MAAENQLNLFDWVDESQAPPQKPKKVANKPKKIANTSKKVANKPKKFTLKLAKGEVAYQCLDCDPKPTIYDRVKPMLKCSKCGMYLEVIDEKIPMIGEN